jgi:glycosyltransferase involved in cell wall biosynthesis
MGPFTVFLPVYNEEEILVANTEKLLYFLDSLQTPYEVLIGSNGSEDATPRLGEALEQRYPQVRFFHLPEKGPGTAFRKAVELMRYGAIISLDMDLSVALQFVSDALQLLADYDIVVGSKKLGIENRSLYRRLGSGLFITYSKWLGLPFDDYSLGAKAYRKSIVETYRDVIGTGTFYVQHILYLAHRDGLKLIQVPVECMDNRSSRFNLWREGFYKFWNISQLWLRRGK